MPSRVLNLQFLYQTSDNVLSERTRTKLKCPTMNPIQLIRCIYRVFVQWVCCLRINSLHLSGICLRLLIMHVIVTVGQIDTIFFSEILLTIWRKTITKLCFSTKHLTNIRPNRYNIFLWNPLTIWRKTKIKLCFSTKYLTNIRLQFNI
jgi:hypothetical protein